MAGYHINDITVGEYGELSKIKEELDEALDAEAQNNRLMVLIELSDVIGAIAGYLDRHYNGGFAPGVTVQDLVTMAQATNRAFINGHRKPKE